MPFIDVDQHSPEWLQMRTGVTTSSRFHDIYQKLTRKSGDKEKGDYKDSRRNYMKELICEKLTGRASSKFVTEWMARGIEDEKEARAAYEMAIGENVSNGGFYLHDSIEYFGASPDARVGETGLLELKNLKPENHYDILTGGSIPDKFVWQMNAQLACAPEREWVDYGSYCKEYMAPKLRLFVRRHWRDSARVEEVEREVRKFNAEMAYELMELCKAQPIEVRDLAEQLTESLGAV